jgi:hypothetical protein
MKKILVCLLTFALTSSPLWAEDGPDQKHIDSIKKKVADCVDRQKRVVVETYDHTRRQGVISEAGTDDFVLNYAGQATTISYRDVKKIHWPSPVMKQVKIMAGAAIFAGVLFGFVVLIGGTKD